jgi:RHS repeat-associated protein
VEAQVPDLTNLTATPLPGAHHYMGNLSETVNPANGAVSVRVGTLAPAGRKMSIPFSFSYDSNGIYNARSVGGWDGPEQTYLSLGGWSYSLPMVSHSMGSITAPGSGNPPQTCNLFTNYIFYDWSGARHLMLNQRNTGGPDRTHCIAAPPTAAFSSAGGIAVLTVEPTHIAELDGTVYHFNVPSFPDPLVPPNQPAVFINIPDFIEDTNGNIATINNLSPQTSRGGHFTITDDLGRTLISASGLGNTGDTVSVAGLSNPYTLSWTSVSVNFTTNWNFIGQEPPPGAPQCFSFQAGVSSTLQAVSAITLPNNQQYTFNYDPTYGMLSQITYPSGGWVKYTWGLNAQSEVRNIPKGSIPCLYQFDRPAIVKRQVSFDGQNVALEQDFQYSSTVGGSKVASSQTTVTTHDLISGKTFSIIYNYGRDTITDSALENTITYQDENGATLKTVNKTWATQAGNFEPALSSESVTLSNGLTSKTTFSYVPTANGFHFFGQLQEKDEYDFGQSTPARKTVYTYQSFSPTPVFPMPAGTLSSQILDRVCSAVTYDGANTRVAETDYLYDGGTTVCGAAGTPGVSAVSSPTGHDETNFSSSAGTSRGNVTQVIHRCIPNCSDAVTKYSYDATGQVVSLTDPQGNVANYSYADSYTSGSAPGNTNAYLTQITHPPTNGVKHIESFSYAYLDGLLTQITDENGNQTGYVYNDLLHRLTETDYADQGQITTGYNDVAPNPSVVTTTKITGSVSRVTTVVVDGMGHTVQSQLNSDPAGVDFTDTTYDGVGRAISVSNPHRAASSPTDGATETAYDVLGRVIKLTKQDGSVISSQYDQTSSLSANATCATTTDETGRQRKACSNALERLVEVDEPGDPSPGIAASGGLTINGSLQTKPATNPTSGTGSVTITAPYGADQSKSGIGAHPGTPGTGFVWISGNAQIAPDGTISDIGTVSVTVNGFTDTTQYSGGSPCCPNFIVSQLIAQNRADNNPYVSYSNATYSTRLDITAKTSGANTNYSLSASTSWDNTDSCNDLNGNPLTPCFPQPSFPPTPSGTTLTGGTDAFAGNTVYDSGTCTVTINGTQYRVNFGQGSSTSSIASALASAINGGSLASASASGATISLKANATGTASNYSLSGGNCSFNSSTFSATSFVVTTSGSSLTGGNNSMPAATDAGTVQLAVGGYSATANYGNGANQDGTAAAVAGDLVAKIKAQLPASNPPFNISATGAGININWNSVGVAGNVGVSTTSTTTQTASFSIPSFASCNITANPQVCGTNLRGGQDPYPSGLAHPLVTLYSYDVPGNLTCVEQHGDAATGTGCSAPPSSDATSPFRVRRFTYNSLAQLVSAKYPESGPISYTYDADGNVLQKTSPAANQAGAATQIISYCYDALNRVTGKAYSPQTCQNGQLPPGTAVVSFSYDSGANGIGHLTSLTDAAGSASFGYDNMGRISTETRTIAGVSKNLGYFYNLDGSLQKLTYPSGAAVTYTPNAAGQTISAVDVANQINYATNATYGPDGSLSGFVSGNSNSFSGVSNSLLYNPRLQVCRITALSSGALPSSCTDSANIGNVFDLSYNLNFGAGDNGDVMGITNYRDQTRSQSFSYDALNRITSAQNAGTDCGQKALHGVTKFWGNSYSYDAWGNLLTKSVTKCNAENLVTSADIQNRLHAVSGTDFQYDAAGNMTYNVAGPLAPQSYTYDAENRITGAGGFTYTYDADGSRVEKSNGSTGTIYWDMTPGVVAESDLSGTLQSEYVFFDGQRVARKDFSGSTTSVSYYFSDHLGSASVITDSSGGIKEDEDYLPYGAEVKFVDNDPNHYKFTGKERDTETQLDYFGARYYGNWLSRFITPDPLLASGHPEEPQSWNRYSYALNNPLRYTDPDGLDAATDFNLLHEPFCGSNGVGGGTSDHGGCVEWSNVDELKHLTERKRELILELQARILESYLNGVNKEMGNQVGEISRLICKMGPDCHINNNDPAYHLDRPANKYEKNGMLIASIIILLEGGEEEAPAKASKLTGRLTDLYLRFSKSGEYKKVGMSVDALSRYTKGELAGDEIMKITRMAREKIAAIERYIYKRTPGPMNKEKAAGSLYSEKGVRQVQKLLKKLMRGGGTI